MADEAANNTNTPAPSGDWTSSLPPDLQPLVQTKGWKTPGDAISSYANLEKTVGLEKLPLPPKDASGNRDWSKWDGWNTLGRPESADKYDVADVQLPEGVQIDDAAKKGFFDHAHKIGLTNAQAKEIFGWYGNFAGESVGGMERLASEQAAAAEAGLKKEWGQAYDANLDLANRVVKQFGGEDLAKELEQTGFGRNANLVKALAKIGKAMAEDGELPDAKNHGAALSPGDAQAQINAMHGDQNIMKILTNKSHPEYAQMVAKRDRLYAAAYPDQAA